MTQFGAAAGKADLSHRKTIGSRRALKREYANLSRSSDRPAPLKMKAPQTNERPSRLEKLVKEFLQRVALAYRNKANHTLNLIPGNPNCGKQLDIFCYLYNLMFVYQLQA